MKTRLKKIQPKRTKSGQFETLCKCILNEETTKNKVFVHLENDRKVSQELILHMLDKKLIENTIGGHKFVNSLITKLTFSLTR